MTTLTDLTPLERAAVERIPRDRRCPCCQGWGFTVQSRWSWRWHAVEQHERVTCAACDGVGSMKHQRGEAA